MCCCYYYHYIVVIIIITILLLLCCCYYYYHYIIVVVVIVVTIIIIILFYFLGQVDLVKPKTILLPLAELLSGSDDSHRHRIGFLVRKWKDKRIPLSEKTEIKRELNKVRKELADKKRFREEYLSNLERAQIERDGVKEPEVGVVDCDHAPATPPISLKPRPLLAMNCWLYFKELFMVSALDGDGLEKLRVSYCKAYA